jgi:hypothetical protein
MKAISLLGSPVPAFNFRHNAHRMHEIGARYAAG